MQQFRKPIAPSRARAMSDRCGPLLASVVLCALVWSTIGTNAREPLVPPAIAFNLFCTMQFYIGDDDDLGVARASAPVSDVEPDGSPLAYLRDGGLSRSLLVSGQNFCEGSPVRSDHTCHS